VTAIILTLRFSCELAALAAVAWCGWEITPALGIAFPLAVAAVWGAWIAPKAARRLPDPQRLALELGVFAAATVAFVSVGQRVVAIVFAFTALTTAGLSRRLEPA